MRFRKSWIMGALALAALSGTAQAQEPQRTPKPDTTLIEKVQVETVVSGSAASGDVLTAIGGPNTFVFLSADASFERNTVKGAPYSAEATTETIQTLGDGNRIVRKNSSIIYRDSEGRTRREQTLGAIGQWTVAGEPTKTISINDPVARVNYILDPKAQTARKMVIQQLLANGTFKLDAPRTATGSASVRVFESTATTTNAPVRERTNGLQPKTESLGKQVIEGVEAEGTRTTVTIPAGQIGNERAIDIVTERWFSPELQVVVYSKKTDPMAGETTYRLTNINRNEPDHSLFEVPAGYKIKEGPEINFFNRERKVFEERKAQQQ
ncbi:MAG TPA: hypothetical protein VJS44_22625 [Pyrinomonadaceae bacterium]|nr:hypothetical protein [Pyrinomonadaceae bacterium]